MFAQVSCRQWTEEVVSVLEKVREQGVSINYPIVFAMLLPLAKCTTKRDFDIDRHVGIANAHTKHIIELIN